MSEKSDKFCVGCGDPSLTNDGLCLYHHSGMCHKAEQLTDEIKRLRRQIEQLERVQR